MNEAAEQVADSRNNVKLTADDIDRFWNKVKRGGSNECWPWTGSRDHDGRGQFAMHDKSPFRAPRIAWMITRGPIPDGMCVLHKCDNPPCCNPAHYFLGTQLDNIQDMIAKGRNSTKGYFQPKLTTSQVIEIRARYAAGGISMKALGLSYGVCASVVHHIVHRLNRRHV